MTQDSNSPSRRRSRAERIFKGLAIALALVFSLAVLIAVHENWSGAREWERVEARLVKEGIELDARKLVGEMPPPADNFGSHPLVTSLVEFEQEEDGGILYDHPASLEKVRSLGIPEELDRSRCRPKWLQRTPPDFGYFAEELALTGEEEEALLGWVRKHESTIGEFDRAAMRPEAVLPFAMEGGFLEMITMVMPHMSDFQNLSHFQALRACAELRAGNEEEARRALHTLMQLGELSSSQPTLISHLVGMASHDLALSVIWYGLDQKLWSRESLSSILSEWEGRPDEIIGNLERALNFELCVFIIGGMDYLKALNSGEAADAISGLTGAGGGSRHFFSLILFSLIPNGIWDHNKAFAAEWLLETGWIPLKERRIGSEKKAGMLESELRIGSFPAPRRFMAGIMVPSVSGIAKRSLSGAVAAEMMLLSCALELHFERTGSYPDSLSELVSGEGGILPRDRFSASGDSIQYRKENGRYVLYSVGESGTDQGGAVKFRPIDPERVDRGKGDLVWGFGDFPGLPEGE